MKNQHDIHARLAALAARKTTRQHGGNPHPQPPHQQHQPGASALEQIEGLAPVQGPQGRTWLRNYTLPTDQTVLLAKRQVRIESPPAQTISPQTLPLLSRDFAPGNQPLPANKICFLDTETTGLAGGTGTVPFLVGIGWWETPNNATPLFQLEQYLIDDFRHEADMLDRLINRLAAFDVLCTYNGRTFDIPLLRTRAALQRIPPRHLRHRQLDLLPPSRRLWGPMLGSATLKSIELGILRADRGPDIDGALIPPIFHHLARTGQPGRMPDVLDHNAWDIVSLATLLTRLLRIAPDPLASGLLAHWQEFAAAARWLETQRRWDDATRAYQRAIDTCPTTADRQNLLARYALACKRQHRWSEALHAWHTLCQPPHPDNPTPWIEIAKYHEHVAKDPHTALATVQRFRRQLALRQELCSYIQPAGENETRRLRALLQQLDKRATRLNARLQRTPPKTT